MDNSDCHTVDASSFWSVLYMLQHLPAALVRLLCDFLLILLWLLFAEKKRTIRNTFLLQKQFDVVLQTTMEWNVLWQTLEIFIIMISNIMLTHFPKKKCLITKNCSSYWVREVSLGIFFVLSFVTDKKELSRYGLRHHYKTVSVIAGKLTSINDMIMKVWSKWTKWHLMHREPVTRKIIIWF